MPSITKDDLMQFLPIMEESITRAEQFNVETGFIICEHPEGEYSSAGECTGDECSLRMELCEPPKRSAVTFHTHPMTGIPTASDKLYELLATMKGYPERAIRPDLVPSASDTISGIIHEVDALCIGNRAGIACYPFKDSEDMPEEGRHVYNSARTALLRCAIAVQTEDQDTIARCNVDLNYLIGHLGVPTKDWFYDEEFWLE